MPISVYCETCNNQLVHQGPEINQGSAVAAQICMDLSRHHIKSHPSSLPNYHYDADSTDLRFSAGREGVLVIANVR